MNKDITLIRCVNLKFILYLVEYLQIFTVFLISNIIIITTFNLFCNILEVFFSQNIYFA